MSIMIIVAVVARCRFLSSQEKKMKLKNYDYQQEDDERKEREALLQVDDVIIYPVVISIVFFSNHY